MLPSRELSRLQCDWLAEARARILRNAGIAKRNRMLELGAGYGYVAPELQRRSQGQVFALDRNLQALNTCPSAVCADAAQLPFPPHCFDLLFSQNFLLWAKPQDQILQEARRVLRRNGTWILLEPDYGGMMEYPEHLTARNIWIEALQRAGADPQTGRKLPGSLSAAGFQPRVELLPRLEPPGAERFDFLLELPLLAEEKTKVQEMKRNAQCIDPALQVAHLPYLLIIADRL